MRKSCKLAGFIQGRKMKVRGKDRDWKAVAFVDAIAAIILAFCYWHFVFLLCKVDDTTKRRARD